MRDLRLRLENQDWECGYCGTKIEPGEEVTVGYDNNVIVHFVCIPTDYAPKGDDDSLPCASHGKHSRECPEGSLEDDGRSESSAVVPAELAIWECKIGEVDRDLLPDGADGPMRDAVRIAYELLTLREPAFIFSGWGAELTDEECAAAPRLGSDETGAKPADAHAPLAAQPSGLTDSSQSHGGYWVFANGGLFDSVLVEVPPLFHIVNLEGQNERLHGGTLCGWARFKEGAAGGAWRGPRATPYVEKGYSDMGEPRDTPGPQVCPRCADALIALYSLGSWEAFIEWAREHRREVAA